MIRSIRAELVKLTRPRFVAIALGVTTLFAIVMTVVGVLLAEPATPGGPPGDVRLLSTEALADAGGGTAVFAQTAGFGAVFLLAVFIATVAGELTRGTFRTMLLQQPARGRVLAGKLAAIVGFTAVLALVAAAIGWVTARIIAPGQGIDVDRWTTMDALGAGLEDYGRLVVFIAGWAVAGHGDRRARPLRPDWSRHRPRLGRADRERHRRRLDTGPAVLPGPRPAGAHQPGQRRDLDHPGNGDPGCLRSDRRHHQRHRAETPRRHGLRTTRNPGSVRRDRITTCDSYGQFGAFRS